MVIRFKMGHVSTTGMLHQIVSPINTLKMLSIGTLMTKKVVAVSLAERLSHRNMVGQMSFEMHTFLPNMQFQDFM